MNPKAYCTGCGTRFPIGQQALAEVAKGNSLGYCAVAGQRVTVLPYK